MNRVKTKRTRIESMFSADDVRKSYPVCQAATVCPIQYGGRADMIADGRVGCKELTSMAHCFSVFVGESLCTS